MGGMEGKCISWYAFGGKEGAKLQEKEERNVDIS